MNPGRSVRPCLAIASSVLAFALLIERAGYLAAVMAAVFVASLGSRELNVRQALLLAFVIAAAMAVLFVGLLDQPLRLVAAF
jgi:predicted neutral ceramidase superfamily lipid hydrolase